ncbi:MAG: amidase [Cyanobacteria bacterium P01_F01_bin.116]
MSDLVFLAAHKLAKMLRDGKLSSQDLLQLHLDQIERHNVRLSAICTLDVEAARVRSQQADEALARGEVWGPLHGVPITVKDIFETAGLRTTAGYIPLKDYVPQQDATVVARLRAAGGIIMGKSNLAELAGDYQSTNPLFPRVNNPWNVAYTAGGSSGGSAVAVATGMSSLEIGNDIAGSVRQPAHFCGVYGLKPTEGRLSTAGHIPETPSMPHCLRQMLTVGCFARSIEDLRLGFSVIAGADDRRPEIPPVPLDVPPEKNIGDLKVAWLDEWPGIPVDCEILTAIQTVIQTVTEAGAQTDRWLPDDFDLSEIWALYGRMAAYVNIYAQPKDWHNVRRSVPLLYRTATQGDRKLRQLGNFARFLPELLRPTLKGYFEALTERDDYITRLDAALEPWDVWLMPVAATAAFTHRPAWSAVEVNGRKYPHAVANGAYTIPFSLSGHPAIVIPVGQTSQGLPIGIQLVGKRWREMELLAIAQILDQYIGECWQPPGF